MSTFTTITSPGPTKSHYTPARPAPTPSSPLYSSPTQKKTMSITQTYHLAHKARTKLSREASRPDHNLRLLVGHANLLDSLMLDLAEAEREQESWFNQSVRGASSPLSSGPIKTAPEDKREHIEWADTIIEEPEEDWEIEDASTSDSDSDNDEYTSDSEDEYDDEGDVEMADAVSLRRVASHPSNYVHHKLQPVDSMDLQQQQAQQEQKQKQDAADEEAVEFEDDDYEEEDYTELTLTRTPSHLHSPPPGLAEDDDSDEDESMMPPSPPTPVVHEFSEKEREAIATTGFYPSQPQSPPSKEDHSSFYDQGFYIPQRNPARLVSAISVY